MLSKKIYINKSDELGTVVEKVLSTSASLVILSIPKFSKLVIEDENLALLKREADGANKIVQIESVDDRVLSLANSLGIEANNPFFIKIDSKPGRVMDIAPRKLSKVAPLVTLVNYKEENIEAEAEAELEKKFGPVVEMSLPRPKLRSLGIVFFILLLSGAMSYLAFVVMPKADITVVAEKQNFSLASIVTIDKTIRNVDVSGFKIPGQVFTEKRNITNLRIKITAK